MRHSWGLLTHRRENGLTHLLYWDEFIDTFLTIINVLEKIKG